MHSKTVLITGATSGIGLATARLLAKTGYRLVLTARRGPLLEEIAKELSAHTAVYTLCFDVSDRRAVEEALYSLSSPFAQVDVLLNNAGNAYGHAPIHEGLPDDWEKMIDINLKGLLWVSRIVSKQMVERRSGHIINIASLAGRETYPGGNVYCASKTAVVALTEAMRKDLNPFGIRVSSVDPGLVETNFSRVRFHGDEQRASAVYKGFTPLAAEDVAECIAFVISRPAHVNIGDLLLLPTDQASSTIVNRKN
jgi:NADP-dependent 3-hydroxy acid dehydrogenase YdfG